MSKPSLNYYQTLHVGKVKTDVIQYISIQSAIDAITDNAAGKRYAVYVHPGTYTEKITMEDYVDLIAQGGRAETIISFTATAHDEPTLTAENAAVIGFTIVSDGNAGAFRARCVQQATAGFAMKDCALVPQNSAAAAIAFNGTASCGIDDSVIDNAAGAATAALFTTGVATYNVVATTFGGATDSIQVTTTPTLNLTDCTLANNFNQDGGTVNVYRSHLEALDCATSACTFWAELSRFTASITTAGAFAHALVLRLCDLTGQGLASAATGATTMQMESCSHVGLVSNAGTGAFTIDNSACTIVSQTNAAGSITVYGGFVGYCLNSTGSVVWWLNDDELKVLTTMKIAHALAAATSGDVILLDQAIFAESNLTAKNGVDIVGEGWGLSIIEATDNANPIVAVGNNITCEIHGVKVSNLGTGGAIHVEPVANNSTLTIEDCWVNNPGASSCVRITINGNGNGTLNARRCNFTSDVANPCVELSQAAGAGLLYFNSWDCNFNDSLSTIDAQANVVTTVNVYRAMFTNCTRAFTSNMANHVINLEDTECNSAQILLAGNTPTVTLVKCNNIGAFTHNTASTVTLNHCRVSGAYTTGAVAAIVTAYATTFAAFTHGGTGAITLDNCGLAAVANNSTATMTIRESHMDNLTQGAAAGTINVYNSSMGDISTGAAGTIRLEGGCRFTDIAANAGVLTWKVDPNHIKVVAGTANMKVADAITLSAAGDVIEIYPGTYAESALTPKPNTALVGSNPDQCLIVKDDAGSAIIMQSNDNVSFSNLTIGNANAGNFAIAVNNNTLTVRNCYVYGTGAGTSIRIATGTLNMYDTRVGAGTITLSTSANTLNMYRCQITTAPIATGGAIAFTMTFQECDFGGQNINSNATGATTLTLIGCTNVGTITNAGTGAFTIRDSDVSAINLTNAAGSVTAYGGNIMAITRASGAFVWWKHDNELYVLPSGATTDPVIASALTAASSGDVIKLTAGTFAASNLTAKNGVNIIGEGWGKSIIETTDNVNPIIALGNLISCEIHEVKVSNLGTGGVIHVEPGGNDTALTLEDCWVTGSGAGDAVVLTIGGAGNATMTARRCNMDGNAATSIVVLTRTAGAGLLYFNSWDCNFTTSGGAANAAIEASAAVVCDVNVFRATFTSCTLAVYSTGANHTIDIEEAEFDGSGVAPAGINIAANAPTVQLFHCMNIGTGTQVNATIVRAFFCRFRGTYTITAGVLLASNCRFEDNVANNGADNWELYSCDMPANLSNNSTATLTMQGGSCTQALQGAAAGTMNIREAAIIGELDCSAGGIINAYNCEVANVDGNGGTITIYGGNLRQVTDATGTVLWKTGAIRYEVLPNMKIQDALTAGAGGEVVIHAGNYAPITNLTVSANTLVRGEGKATIITPTGAAITNGIVLNGDNITLKDMKVILAAGAGAGGTRPNVVYATGRTLLWVENLWLVGDTTVGDDGADTKQDGLCFISCTYSKIANCQSQTNIRSGIYLEAAGTSGNNTVIGNTSRGNTRHGIFLFNSLHNTVTGNTCQGNAREGIWVNVGDKNTITGNTCQGNTYNGIYIDMCSYNTITGNTCQGNAMSGILVFPGDKNTITGNTCQGNTDTNIKVLRASYCVIAGNSCNGSTAGDGISVTGDGTGNADYNNITGNVCTGNAGKGIWISAGVNANYNVVVANQLHGNTGANLTDGGTNTELGHNQTL